MADFAQSTTRRKGIVGAGFLWLVAAIAAAICVLPHVSVLIAAFLGSTETLQSLAETVLGRYTRATVGLLFLVVLFSTLIGTVAAWLVTTTEFFGRRVLEIALVLPLAFPAYVLAYAYTHVLDHPGIVQTTLRSVMGWGPRDYWFPEIRSLGGAAAMLTLVLYPYVYLLARAAFSAQSATTFYAARSLGQSRIGAFWRISLPLARPAIASGAMLVGMETIADFGTVSYFGVQTFAVGIYSSWFTFADRAAAAQLSLGLLAFALLLAIVERINRGEARYAFGRKFERMPRVRLTKGKSALAFLACFLPAFLGGVWPVVMLAEMAMGSEQSLFSPRYLKFVQNSITLGVVAALVTVSVAVLFGSLARTRKSWFATIILYIGRLGYAVPGGVIAVGLLVPFALFDNALDAYMRTTFGISTGLLFTGSIWLLVCAYMIRFLAAAIGAYEGGVSVINPNMDAAARVLGQNEWGLLRRIHFPLLRPSLFTALLIVFVDVMKELPATLIMRPFNFDTLAVQAHRLASDERLSGAAVPSLVIVAIGILPVILLCLRIRTEQDVKKGA
ncbi:iron ABC transporter permease [Marivita sp. GX14005]|uniref:ABC transporter permease n=1 Tax=Marivita sp. GX14005 TaxID=2942276 RepID=UPI0020197E0A|nr:iron ABC transporter permease [Marivita sp. GX14005]MCL3881884.1 iron ABC transporter permease [Marivita sp. GX14005]